MNLFQDALKIGDLPFLGVEREQQHPVPSGVLSVSRVPSQDTAQG